MFRQRFPVYEFPATNLAGLLRIVFVFLGSTCGRHWLWKQVSCLLLQFLSTLNSCQRSKDSGSPLLMDAHVSPNQSRHGRLVVAIKSRTFQQVHIYLVALPQVGRASPPIGELQSTLTASKAAVLVAPRVQFHFLGIQELECTVFAKGAPKIILVCKGVDEFL